MKREIKRSFKAQTPGGLWLVVYNAGFQKCGSLHSWGPGVRDHYLLHHIVSGKGIFRRDGETFLLAAGESFLISPGEQVFYAADRDDPWEYYWAGFAGEGAAQLLAHSEFSGGCPVLRHPVPGLRQGLLEVYKARGGDFASSVRMSGCLQAALGLLIDGGDAAPDEDYAQRGARYLEYNYAQPVTIEETARQAGVSRSQLYRGFLSRFGCSPKEYLGQIRLAAAARLLRRGDLPVGRWRVPADLTIRFIFPGFSAGKWALARGHTGKILKTAIDFQLI